MPAMATTPRTERPRRPFWLPSVAALALLALTISAGIWQTHRAETKRALQAQYDAQAQAPAQAVDSVNIDPDALRFRRVKVTGYFDTVHEVWLDNRIYLGKPGYEIITPLKLASAPGYILIDRGWVARGLRRTELPETKSAPPGLVGVEGIATTPSGRYVELSKQTVEGKVWENLDVPRMQKLLPERLAPLMVVQLDDKANGLIQHWDRPDSGIAMHVGYAFQWFAMALATIVIYGVLYVRRHKSQ